MTRTPVPVWVTQSAACSVVWRNVVTFCCSAAAFGKPDVRATSTAGEVVRVVVPRPHVGRLGDGLRGRALVHVALAARLAAVGVGEDGALPLRVGPLDGRSGRRDDVVAGAAHARALDVVAVLQDGVGRGVPRVGHGIRVLPAHHEVARQRDAALCEPVTASIVWQKKQVTPLSFCGTDAMFVPSVVAPSSSAMGAWHCTQKLPS